jgi:glycosyltransferase involved in cell wall biosynthesis
MIEQITQNERLMAENIWLSIVVPLYNESKSVDELYARLKKELEAIGKSYEIIFIDDGSKDDTVKLASAIAAKDKTVTLIQLARNYGQSSALLAGFDQASGDVIISMDGDLQHDPAELPLFIEKINEGYDIVSGWRKQRVDNLLIRRIPSRMANLMLQKVSGVEINDFGTTYKAYRREFINNIDLFGDFHRYIPALANDLGASIIEIPIKNINRPQGRSNYGIKRFWPVMLDIIMLKFVVSYMAKPLRMFGSIGLSLFLSGFAISAWMMLLWCVRIINTIRDHSAMLLFSIFLMLVGIQFIVFGILAEINSKIYFKVNNRRVYRIKRIVKK